MNRASTLILAAAFASLTGAAYAQSTSAEAPQAAQPAAPGAAAYTDAQLQSFAAASNEIDPISRSLQGATPEAQAQAATQIRAILQRNNLDGATYNSIAGAAQSDPALAQRIASLRTASGGATGGAQN